MEQTLEKKKAGLSSLSLRAIAFLFLIIALVGEVIFQNTLLNISQHDSESLLQAMQGSETVMLYASLALAMQALGTCAVPLFAFLCVQGGINTKSFTKYLVRVGLLSLICEIPYNFAVSGKLLDLTTRNPVFSVVFAVIMMYFYRRYAEKTTVNTLIKLAVTVAAIAWVSILRADEGLPMILLVAVLWALREKPTFRTLAGCVVATACSIISPFYSLSLFAFIFIHLYNGEKGGDNKVVNYAAYPVILVFVVMTAYMLKSMM